jgi:hypothetical protein
VLRGKLQDASLESWPTLAVARVKSVGFIERHVADGSHRAIAHETDALLRILGLKASGNGAGTHLNPAYGRFVILQ